MIIILLGAPGSGKGTQAQLLSQRFNLFYLQTGQLVRELAKKDERIAQIYKSGKLIPENEMTMYVIDHLKQKSPNMKNILFEGFPRFISQFEALASFLHTKGYAIDAIFSLDISKKEAVRRISARRICLKCGEVYNLITNPPPKTGECNCGGKLIQRPDDNPEAIKVRFEYYTKNTKKLIDYVAQKKLLTRINGERPIEEIQKDLVAAVNKLKK